MAGGLPPFALATTYRIVYGIATSYLVARLAPDRPMLHALVFGGIGVALSTAAAVATWGRGPEFGPKWYALAIIAIAMPCAWWAVHSATCSRVRALAATRVCRVRLERCPANPDGR